MNNDEFRKGVEDFLRAKPSGLVVTIPEGSGLFRVVGVPITDYQSAFVSTNPGGLNDPETSGKWYANSFELAIKETRFAGERTCEYSELRADLPALNLDVLPAGLQEAIREDKDVSGGAFEKSQIVLSGVREFLPHLRVGGVRFPSRRGDGTVLVFNTAEAATKSMWSGENPPGPGDLPPG